MEFKTHIKEQFRKVTNPQQLMSNAEFVEFFKKAYYSVFHVHPVVYTCGVCMYEHWKELEQLTEEQIKFRQNMKNNIKEGRVMFASNGRPYSRKSADITQEILDELQAKYPDDFEAVEPVEEIQHPAIKPATRKTRK